MSNILDIQSLDDFCARVSQNVQRNLNVWGRSDSNSSTAIWSTCTRFTRPQTLRGIYDRKNSEMKQAQRLYHHKYSRKAVIFAVLSTCVGVLLLQLFRQTLQSVQPCEFSSVLDPGVQNKEVLESEIKNILLWNSPERIETAAFGIGSTEHFERHGCEANLCQIFHNRSALPFEQFDAVLFNVHTLHDNPLPAELGYKRTVRQRFVLLTQESPDTMFFFNPTAFNGYFNWTMSYKLNSDIQLLYGRVKKKKSATSYQMRSTRERKTAVWMASHCQTSGLRESYVAELRQYIDVAIYGSCGDLTCPRNNEHWISEPVCYDLLSKNYKFYLSFENSVCRDYVTEKFFNVLQYDIVPVVYGGANYTALAPPYSFIDALKFTPRRLAEYLMELDSNESMYRQYFAWKEHYIVESGVVHMSRHGFCDLCKKLQLDTSLKVYGDLEAEWSSETQCRKMASWEIPNDCYGK